MLQVTKLYSYILRCKPYDVVYGEKVHSVCYVYSLNTLCVGRG